MTCNVKNSFFPFLFFPFYLFVAFFHAVIFLVQPAMEGVEVRTQWSAGGGRCCGFAVTRGLWWTECLVPWSAVSVSSVCGGVLLVPLL